MGFNKKLLVFGVLGICLLAGGTWLYLAKGQAGRPVKAYALGKQPSGSFPRGQTPVLHMRTKKRDATGRLLPDDPPHRKTIQTNNPKSSFVIRNSLQKNLQLHKK